MKHSIHWIAAIFLALCAGGEVWAQTSAGNSILIEQPFARATPKGAKTGAAYMTLENNGTSDDRLIGATTPLGDKVQFHKETEDNGVSRMREVHSVDLAPGAKVAFRPGDMHMMIVGLKQPLEQGKTLPLTLQFEKAGGVEVTVPIQGIGAMHHGDMDSMTHGSDGAMKK